MFTRNEKLELIQVNTSISDGIRVLQKLVFCSFLDSFMRQDIVFLK